MIQVAIDSDLFFFSIANSNKASRKLSPASVKNLLQHISTHKDRFELCVSSTVLAETVMVCLENKKHDIDELHELITFWGGLNIKFLHPNDVAAYMCNLLVNKYKDMRMMPTDVFHIGYALAYDMDYFISTDRLLLQYKLPEGSKLKVIHPDVLRTLIR